MGCAHGWVGRGVSGMCTWVGGQGCEWDVHMGGGVSGMCTWVGRGVSGMYVRTCVR